jgi:hypothetical protein
MDLAISFAAGTLIMAACLWAGMRLTGVGGAFAAMLAVAAIASALQLIPFVGWLIALVAMLSLISRWTDAPVWPDAVLMVLVANLLAIVGTFVLSGVVGGF